MTFDAAAMTTRTPTSSFAKTREARRTLPDERADLLIIGAGLVGGALAAVLGSAGWRVILVDKTDPTANLDAGFDGRATAIAQSTHGVLRAGGLWDDLEPQATPIKDIRVADGISPLFLHYDHAAVGDQPFGYMLENRHLRRALHKRNASLKGVHWAAPAEITALETSSNGAAVTLTDGRRLTAPLVVGADGRGSWVRTQAGIRITGWSYGQVAFVTTVEHEHHHGFVAHEHFLPAGPFAILPIQGDPERPGHRSSLVWTEKAGLADEISALDDQGFLREVALRFGDFLGAIEVVGPRWRYPLGLQYAETAVAERLVLIGDALHGMHPIAGQGFNMGLRDVAALAEVLTDARRLGLDYGDATTLTRYQRWRRFDNHLMLVMTDNINRLFSNRIPPVRRIRDLGLGAVERLPGLKKVFMRQAMGASGELPRVMRGEAL